MRARTRLLRADDLRQLLVNRGLRVTTQRMIILRELAKLRIPTSHAEMTERLSSSGPNRVTIYRNLLSLTKAGLLVKTQLGDNVWRFELPQASSEGHVAHPHFICDDCGSIACLPESSVVLRGQAVRYRDAQVQLRGRCPGCSRS